MSPGDGEPPPDSPGDGETIERAEDVHPGDGWATCVVCGGPIVEAAGETPVYLDPETAEEVGDHEGNAYHLHTCEDGVFEEVHCEL